MVLAYNVIIKSTVGNRDDSHSQGKSQFNFELHRQSCAALALVSLRRRACFSFSASSQHRSLAPKHVVAAGQGWRLFPQFFRPDRQLAMLDYLYRSRYRLPRHRCLFHDHRLGQENPVAQLRSGSATRSNTS